MFADDIILCGQLNESSSSSTGNVLSQFSAISGQKVNSKSKIFFSINTPLASRNLILSHFNMVEGHRVKKYLGYPISTNNMTKENLQFLLDNLMSLLAGWKMKFLTKAGRTMLIHSTLNSLLNHVMMLFQLPIHLLEKIELYECIFYWGDSQTHKKLHLIKWSTITKAK